MDRVNFMALAHELRLSDHVSGSQVGLLVESILDKLLLKEEVLEFLLLLAFAFQV